MSRAVGEKKIRQKPSHYRLLQDVSQFPAATSRTRRNRLDVIIVPATRPASSFTGLIDLSARIGTLLVVLCSKQTKVDQVAERVARTRGARALVIEIPKDYRLPDLSTWTSAAEFTTASGGRASDLSAKRNLGLLLARLNGWNKVVFLDDDITLSRTESFTRLAEQLDRTQIAGMVCRDFPDNSVVCHARRLAKLPQDNFVSGSVLGVHCGDLPVPFFPDIYNEDWFFFSKAAARRELSTVGDATQAAYEPFADPIRARHEEFGDLLAEGLFTLIGNSDPSHSFKKLLSHASEQFWSHFIDARQNDLDLTDQTLARFVDDDNGDDEVHRAARSLAAAKQQLGTITPALCTDFLDAWQDDMHDWDALCKRTSSARTIRHAVDAVGVGDWRLAQFGNPDVSSAHVPALVRG